MDECTDGNFPNNCGPNTLCTNTVGSFSCACVTGSSSLKASCKYITLVPYNPTLGYTSWAANSGCRDINECCVGSHAECSHTCSRSSATSGICFNTAGSYECKSCNTGGTVLSSSGRLFSMIGEINIHSFLIQANFSTATMDGMGTQRNTARQTSSGP